MRRLAHRSARDDSDETTNRLPQRLERYPAHRSDVPKTDGAPAGARQDRASEAWAREEPKRPSPVPPDGPSTPQRGLDFAVVLLALASRE